MLSLASFGTPFLDAQVLIRGPRLLVGESALTLRGVTYSPTPIGRTAGPTLTGAGCLYARDLPLIAAMGANAIRTPSRVDPADATFRRALADTGLYWLASFPLEPYFDPSASLDPEAPGGIALRDRIAGDFLEYARSWAGEPRLVAISFGNEVGDGYSAKFAGERRHYYSLLAEVARRVADEGLSVAVAASVAEPTEIGAFNLGTTDVLQPDLALWLLDRSGSVAIGGAVREARGRTSKAIVLSGFGVDAYDQGDRAANPTLQGELSGALAAEIEVQQRSQTTLLSGAFWNGYVDEWWRGGAADLHGAGGTARADAPDGFWNPGWSGLFRAVRTGVDGFDSLQPRPVYFTLAAAWKGSPPPELSAVGSPVLAQGGVVNGVSGFGAVARGGLLAVAGEGLSGSSYQAAAADSLPPRLGAVSLCVGGYNAPLFRAEPAALSAQAPWEADEGLAQTIAYRAGVASNPEPVELRRAAPGVLDRGVFRPGLPCPVDEYNGVPPGSFLEVYGSGLGEGVAPLDTGTGAPGPLQTALAPRARLNGFDIPVLYSGLFPGAAGVYQTNVQIPEDFPSGLAELRLESDGYFSNPHRIEVLNSAQKPVFGLGQIEPSALVVQEGGEGKTAYVEVVANHGFCDVVRFQISGLPAGVRATIPVGLPGQFLPITVWAEPGAARVDAAPITITGLSTAPATVNVRKLSVTVLPGSGDIALRVVSGGFVSSTPLARFEVEGRSVFETTGGGPGRGFNFLTLNDRTGEISPVRTFDTWGSDAAVTAMETYLRSLPRGTVVLGAIADDGVYRITDETRRVLAETLGAQLIDQVQYQWSWAIISRAGATQPMAERLSPISVVVLDRVLSFPLEAP
ncbi:MAG: hypothetical protein GC160_28635 [Acidobacteria bacterium]|nr:hypothetical protein [Acidobacteriota bacterium]